jgi:hypothetical protein
LGCHDPTNATSPFVESSVLTIPPPAIDLVLHLDCSGATAELFRCTAASGSASISPGLGHDPAAQSVIIPPSGAASISGCNGGPTVGTVTTGVLRTFPSRPLSCPATLGGTTAYPDKTFLLLGVPPDGFTMDWSSGPNSGGTLKMKAAATPDRWIAIFVIQSGQFLAPAGQKTKIKGTVSFHPTGSYDCSGNSDRITDVAFSEFTDVIATQK